MAYIEKLVRRFVITVGRYESRPTADSWGMMSEHVGDDDWEIEVEINMNAIVNYQGQKAVNSKGGKAKEGYVTVTRRRKLRSQKRENL